jgi:hypothetical protein
MIRNFLYSIRKAACWISPQQRELRRILQQRRNAAANEIDGGLIATVIPWLRMRDWGYGASITTWPHTTTAAKTNPSGSGRAHQAHRLIGPLRRPLRRSSTVPRSSQSLFPLAGKPIQSDDKTHDHYGFTHTHNKEVQSRGNRAGAARMQ